MESIGNHYSYDEVPYPDLSYTQTHPSRLEMLGKLLGMKPAPVEACRVLEIGTASGANLLPMAATLPNSTFVGMDLSAVQIGQAQAMLEGSGLTNISFHQMDIMDITPEFGQFDYIITHGIFSWVPPAVREKILEVCRENLAPQGIAYISYNTYPGWHTMQIIRDMMLYRSRNANSPAEKSAQAREWVSFMADALKDRTDSAYSAVFQNYMKFRHKEIDAFNYDALLHDELEAYNQPFYFYEFVERAEQHGLQYLVESDFPTVMPNGLPADVLDFLSKTARTTIELEQYFDYLRNRNFRRTLLCHEAVEVDRRLSIRPLSEFYLSSVAHTVTADAEKAARGIQTFEGFDGSQFSTDHALTIAAFHTLLEAKPGRIHFDELVRQATTRINVSDVSPDDRNALAANCLRAFSYSMDLIEFHTFAPHITNTVSERPLTTAFIRFQTRQQPNISSVMHGRMQLDNFTRLILAQLDGQNDHGALLDFLVELAETGKISLPTAEEIPESPAEMREMLSFQLEMALEGLAYMGLLVG